MAGLLSAFLREASGRRWEWGVTDCLMVPSDWIALVRGADPAAPWRGSYSTEQGCTRLLLRRGGMIAHCDDALSRIGVRRAGVGRPGDFALVRALCVTGIQTVGAIMVSDREVAIMTQDRGIVMTSVGVEPVATWGVV